METLMESPNPNEELLMFFRALSDKNRLKIVGLLAQHSCTVEQLAALLELSESTTSHHLSTLSYVGLVEARTDGHYYQYFLRTDTLQEMAARLLKTDELPRLSEQVDLEAYDRKVLQSFLDKNGHIKAFPTQEKKLLVLLRHVIKDFEPGKHYTEKEVNAILSKYNPDVSFLRRSLIEAKLMARQANGAEYWRLD
jgi:DNA-binding transcriptional ArsR family regulator